MKWNLVSIICFLIIIFTTGCNNIGKLNEEDPSKLTLKKVKKLAEKGDKLSWVDFEIYEGIEMGSGLYIIEYPIDDEYVVLIGGGDLKATPMYIKLVNKDTEEDIDIRQDDINDFINNGE